MAFQWLTGSLPFDADTPQAVILKQVLDPLPEVPLRALPVPVAAALRQALDKDPARRPPSAGALIAQLATAMGLGVADSRPPPVQPTQRVEPAARFPGTNESMAPGSRPPPVPPLPGADAGGSPMRVLGVLAGMGLLLGVGWWTTRQSGAPPVEVVRPSAPPASGPSPVTASPAPAPSPVPPAPAKSSDGLVLLRRGDPLPTVGVPFRHALRSGGEGPVMVGVPGGRFRMGSPETEAARDGDEGPVREVTIGAYAAGKFEVTVSEFRRFVSATGHVTDAEANVDVPDDLAEVYKVPNLGCYVFQQSGQWTWESGRSWKSPGLAGSGEGHPAVCVSWNDAQAYVRWLSGETGAGYRLPSEAEQEWQLRGGRDGQVFGWGSEVLEACRYGNVGGMEGAPNGGSSNPVVPCNDGSKGLSAVGRYGAQAFGLHDMLGNALEWGQDCYRGSYAGAPLDGSAVEREGCRARVLRGASWSSGPARLRSADRGGGAPSIRFFTWGFRVALDR